MMLLVAALTLTGAMAAGAQVAQPTPGARVRVTVAANSGEKPRVVVGRLMAATESSVVVRRLNAEVDETLAMSRVERMQVRVGADRKSSAVYGALIGLFAGAVIGYSSGEDCTSEDWICFDRGETGVAGAALGTGLGAIVGYAVGAVDRWSDVSIPSRVLLQPSPTGGVRLGASLGF
jgi:hypothetical protein